MLFYSHKVIGIGKFVEREGKLEFSLNWQVEELMKGVRGNFFNTDKIL